MEWNSWRCLAQPPVDAGSFRIGAAFEHVFYPEVDRAVSGEMTHLEQSKAATIEMLRRRIAAVPNRTSGSSRPPLTELPTTPAAQTEPVPAPPPARSTSALGVLSVPSAIASLLPRGGLVRGSTVHLAGSASLQVGLLASVTGAGGWAAVVGHPKLGILAAVEMGANLRRCAFCETGSDAVEVAAILVEGIDLVVVDLGGTDVPPSRARAVTARVRRHGTVLAVTNGRWPTVDLHLDAQVAGYTGVGPGYGRITGTSLDVEATGRGQLPRRARIDISGGHDRVSWTATGHEATPPLRAAR